MTGFDHISHYGLMERIRRRVDDSNVNRLIVVFLKEASSPRAHSATTYCPDVTYGALAHRTPMPELRNVDSLEVRLATRT